MASYTLIIFSTILAIFGVIVNFDKKKEEKIFKKFTSGIVTVVILIITVGTLSVIEQYNEDQLEISNLLYAQRKATGDSINAAKTIELSKSLVIKSDSITKIQQYALTKSEELNNLLNKSVSNLEFQNNRILNPIDSFVCEITISIPANQPAVNSFKATFNKNGRIYLPLDLPSETTFRESTLELFLRNLSIEIGFYKSLKYDEIAPNSELYFWLNPQIYEDKSIDKTLYYIPQNDELRVVIQNIIPNYVYKGFNLLSQYDFRNLFCYCFFNGVSGLSLSWHFEELNLCIKNGSGLSVRNFNILAPEYPQIFISKVPSNATFNSFCNLWGAGL